MNRIEFRKSPLKAVGLLLGGFALVAASILATRIGEDAFIRAIGWFGAVFFGLAVVKAAYELFSRRVVYVFDDEGIHDLRSGIGLIPWSAITRVEVLSIHGTRFLLLQLDRPADYLQRVSPMQRRLAALNRSVDWGDWSLSFVGITPGIEVAQELVTRRVA